MEPKEFFKKEIIGKLTTRTIDKLFTRDGEGLKHERSSISETKDYDVIDIVDDNSDESSAECNRMFITNTWQDESTHSVLYVHNNFVQKYRSLK